MATRLKIIILLTLFLINPVTAKFICGEVSPAQEISPSWHEVEAFLAEDKTQSSNCLVSPSNNRYCCDIDAIKDKTNYEWSPGDIFKIKITETSSGYFATEKTIALTGEGYDIAPNLDLQKAIEITYPKATLTISNKNLPIETTVSNDCSETTRSQENTFFGENKISISTICNKEKFSREKTFFIIQNMSFQKTYSDFSGTTSKPKIKDSKTGTINLAGTLSSPVKNIELKEYIPNSWQVSEISNNGKLQYSTPEYNVITWEVNGENFNFNYKIKSPEVGLIQKSFTFKTFLDENSLDETTIQVYKIILVPFASSPSSSNHVYIPEKFSKVSPDLPLVFTSQNLSSALYSKEPKQNQALSLIESNYKGKLNKNFDLIKYYQVQTTLPPEEREKMAFEYKTEKDFLEKNNYKEIGLFKLKEDKFIKISKGESAQKEDSIIYRFESSEPLNEFFILAEKNKTSFWKKFLSIISKINFW